MSCTVVAIPWALVWVVGSLIPTASAAAAIAVDKTTHNHNNNNDFIEPACEENLVISEKQFLEKSFETPFVDKNILLKTLEEHGVTNIKESDYGQIKGVTGNFVLTFERSEEDKPYSVVIRYLSTEDVEEKVDNLTSEYAINVQEECYNNIVAKLNDNNMEIESEEVCDDDTIVITVNLE